MRDHRVKHLPGNPAVSPAVKNHILATIKRLDPTGHLQFCEYAINDLNGDVFVADGGFVTYRPRWHYWTKDGAGFYHKVLTLETPEGNFQPADERLIRWMEENKQRMESPKKQWARFMEMKEQDREKRLKKITGLQRDVELANAKKFREVQENPFGMRKGLVEDGRIVSFGGQTNRSRAEEKPADPSIGYELPDWNKELNT